MADGGGPRRTGAGKSTMAQRADLHEVYEAAVQTPDVECDYMASTFRRLRSRSPQVFREDFCGTASVACEWVRGGPRRRSIGVDLDGAVLDWGRERNLDRLTSGQKERVNLIQGDVSTVRTAQVDMVGAFNFSYWVFKTRPAMLRYFRRVRQSLVADGIFFLDAFGGYEAYQELKETTRCKGFTYVWHQEKYYPITGDILCHIGFQFPDGSRIDKAFSYDWRLWSMPELRELLEEAGFSRITTWWEGTGKDGRGNGVFTPEDRGEADAGWVAYIVAER